MKTLTIRGIDRRLSDEIKKHAQKKQISINQWALELLKRATSLDKDPYYKVYHDLDYLAGTWNSKDTIEFNKNTEDFSKIDKDIW